MAKLFKRKDTDELHSARVVIVMTAAEKAEIRHLAQIRQLDVSEFMRRSALGKRADINFDVECVIALMHVAKSIRALHAAVLEKGLMPPEDEWRPVIAEARDAISKMNV